MAYVIWQYGVSNFMKDDMSCVQLTTAFLGSLCLLAWLADHLDRATAEGSDSSIYSWTHSWRDDRN